MVKLDVTHDGPPVGDQIRYCEWCRLYRHKTAFKPGRGSCQWCWDAWVSRRDDGLRKGHYTASEIAGVFSLTDPPSPWMPGDVFHQTYTDNPTIQELNAPFVGEDESKEIPEITQEIGSTLWLPREVSYRLKGRGPGSSPPKASPKG